MIKIIKRNNKIKKIIFLKSSLGNINFFFIDHIFFFNEKIKLYKKKKIFFFETSLGCLFLKFIDNIFFFIKKKKVLLNFNLKKKKSIINFYNKLIKIKKKSI